MLKREYAYSPEFFKILGKKFIFFVKICIPGIIITFVINSILITPAYSQSAAQIEEAKAKLSTNDSR